MSGTKLRNLEVIAIHDFMKMIIIDTTQDGETQSCKYKRDYSDKRVADEAAKELKRPVSAQMITRLRISMFGTIRASADSHNKTMMFRCMQEIEAVHRTIATMREEINSLTEIITVNNQRAILRERASRRV